jgi:hypothetical protein
VGRFHIRIRVDFQSQPFQAKKKHPNIVGALADVRPYGVVEISNGHGRREPPTTKVVGPPFLRDALDRGHFRWIGWIERRGKKCPRLKRLPKA